MEHVECRVWREGSVECVEHGTSGGYAFNKMIDWQCGRQLGGTPNPQQPRTNKLRLLLSPSCPARRGVTCTGYPLSDYSLHLLSAELPLLLRFDIFNSLVSSFRRCVSFRFAVILFARNFAWRNHSHVNNRITHAPLDLTPNRLDELRPLRVRSHLPCPLPCIQSTLHLESAADSVCRPFHTFLLPSIILWHRQKASPYQFHLHPLLTNSLEIRIWQIYQLRRWETETALVQSCWAQSNKAPTTITTTNNNFKKWRHISIELFIALKSRRNQNPIS